MSLKIGWNESEPLRHNWVQNKGLLQSLLIDKNNVIMNTTYEFWKVWEESVIFVFLTTSSERWSNSNSKCTDVPLWVCVLCIEKLKGSKEHHKL